MGDEAMQAQGVVGSMRAGKRGREGDGKVLPTNTCAHV